MSVLIIFIKLIAVFDLLVIAVYFGGDILSTMLNKLRRKPKQDDPFDFSLDTVTVSLSIDSIRQLCSDDAADFVEEKILPNAEKTMAVLTEQEQTAARLLLSALIGFLAAEAPMDEQSFPLMMELLNCMEGEKEDGCQDAVDSLLEDAACNTRRHEEYYSNYQRYQLMQVDKTRVILACRIIINDLLGKLYRYDYRFGYNLLLDEENSIEKKLHTRLCGKNGRLKMMRYKLVIAEKPSVAQSLAAVIGATARKDGYLEGNGWRVSWCVGHLAGLADADSYDPKYAKWRYDDLPILPEHWQMVVGKDKKKQFDILKKLMNAPDVTEVVNACDAGREGELIFRSVYELADCQKPMKRLWISSMEDSAIREGFANLRPGADYDGLRDAALCRAKADWLVGINATRLFSVLYHRTLNIGRVMSPTLALIVQREAEIDTFKPVPFYTVALELPGLTVSGERMADKAAAKQLKETCRGANVTIKKVECKEKSEKPPALYDLTTLQRDANRLLGFTAQQTLDYLQSLYEKKLCTYPRTDSRYLTGDMADSLPVLVNLVANAMPFRKGIAITCDPQTVINDKKVTDHHAVIPTRNLKDADLSALPAGEKAVLELVALRLLCAVAQPHIYSETVVIAACAGGEFTAKGKTVKHPGWKALEDAYRAKMKDAEPKKEGAEKALPELTEGQTLSVAAAIVKEGKSSPPQHFTEDTLLSAMETAGKEDMPEDAERKGLGTPATRAGILEKLVSAGFLERKKSRKTVQLLPSHDAVSLITVLPEQLQSPLLTAEWEYRLGEIERGQLAPEEFLDGISTMLKDLVGTYQVIKGTEYLFTPPREVVGKCPRCGGEVAELQKGFFCQNDSCKFAIWKNNKWWAAKKKQPTKAVVSALLNDGRVRVTGLYSEKTGKTYDAAVVLEDDGQYANFKLEFDQRKGGSR